MSEVHDNIIAALRKFQNKPDGMPDYIAMSQKFYDELRKKSEPMAYDPGSESVIFAGLPIHISDDVKTYELRKW